MDCNLQISIFSCKWLGIKFIKFILNMVIHFHVIMWQKSGSIIFKKLGWTWILPFDVRRRSKKNKTNFFEKIKRENVKTNRQNEWIKYCLQTLWHLRAFGAELDFRPGHNLRRNLPMEDGGKYNHGNLDRAVSENVNFKSNWRIGQAP